MEATKRKDTRLEFRVTSAEKRLIAQAAHLRGQSLSGYAISTLVEDARQVIDNATRIELSNRDRDEFLAILDADDEPNEALTKAAQEYLAAQNVR